MHGFIGQGDVQGVAVCIGENCNRFDAQTFSGADYSARDFATISDKDFVEHGYILNTPKRVSAMGLFSDADSARPSTRRVSMGLITPSSQRRALA